jgi:hypothetical protein
MSNVKGFTASQMDIINAMLAAAVTEAVATTVAAMSAPAMQATPVPRTLAKAKHNSITERLHRVAVKTATAINDAAGTTSNFAADKLSTLEVKAVPAVVKTTGIVCTKSAFTAVAIGNTLSSFADRCAAARVRMEFVK